MGLRIDPNGGGQFNQAVRAIMEAEKVPLKALESHKTKEESRLKLFQEFKGKFANFDKALMDVSNFSSFKEYKVDLGDGANLISVSVDKTKAQPGNYELEVSQLASRSSVVTNGFSSPDEKNLGAGYVVVYDGKGDKEELYIGSDNASLNGVANLINSKQDSAIRASVIKDDADPDAPYRLLLASKKEGVEEAVDFPDFYFLDGSKDLHIDKSHDSQNAILKINGYEMEAGQNKIPDFLTGVGIELKQAQEGKRFTMNISEDTTKMAGKIKGVVDQINGILEFINKQNTVDDKSDTSAGFTGDTSLQTVEFRLRNLLHEGFPVWDNPDDPEKPRYVFLNQMGVEFDKSGKLSYTEDKFTKALQRDFNGVSTAVAGEYGFASQIREVMKGYTRPGDGFLALRETGMRNRIRKIDDDIENKNRLLARKQEQVTNQFARLQSTMAAMQQQQAQMSATLGGGGGGNLISQLMGG